MRRLAREPLSAGGAIVIAAVAIAATTATFSILDTVLLRPLPYPEADRLVQVSEFNTESVALGRGGFRDGPVNAQNFFAYESAGTSFDALGWAAEYALGEGTAAAGDGPTQVVGVMSVSPSFFDVLGVTFGLGRNFLAEETASRGPTWRPERVGVVILSHELWAGRYASDPDIIGREITFDGGPATVVGVLPEGFRFPPLSERGGVRERRIDLYIPRYVSTLFFENHEVRHFAVIGLLRPGVTAESAQADLGRVLANLRDEYPETQEGWSVAVTPITSLLARDFGFALALLMGLVVIAWLIACGNLAALTLAQLTRRNAEFAVRTALGGSRNRILRLLASESLVLAAMSGLLGVVLAKWGLDALVAIVPADLPRAREASLDGRVLGFAVIVSLLTALASGLLPALLSSNRHPGRDLRAAGVSGRRTAIPNSLLTGQVALTLALLMGAAVFGRSFMRLRSADPGLDYENVLRVSINRGSLDDYFEIAYWDMNQRRARWQLSREVMERIRTLPGVEEVGSGDVGIDGTQVYRVQIGPPSDSSSRLVESFAQFVSPEYFATLGIPIVRGNGLDSWSRTDDADQYWWTVDGRDCQSELKRTGNPRLWDPSLYCGGPGVLVSQSFANFAWPGEDPIGKELGMGGCCWRVIGVAADVHTRGVDAPVVAGAIGREPERVVYVPYTDLGPFLVRTSVPPLTLVPAVRRIVTELNVPGAATFSTLEQRVTDSLSRPRLYSVTAGVFGSISLLMALVGLYGAISFAVGRRVREIGVRVALGATRAQVHRMIVTEGLRPVLWGLPIGAIGAVGLLTVMERLLYGMAPLDPLVTLLVPFLFLLISAIACYAPARRATQVSPAEALAHD